MHLGKFSSELASQGDDNGHLMAYEIYRLDLTKHTDLVILSGCETAVGKLSEGDEFTSLSRAFLYAGAPRVIASLWSVDDKATSLLMEAFFKFRKDGKSTAEALRQAQLTLRSQPQYNNPYYWAGFILTGND